MTIPELLAVCEAEKLADDIEINPQACTLEEIQAFQAVVSRYIRLGLFVLPAALRCLAEVRKIAKSIGDVSSDPFVTDKACGIQLRIKEFERFEAGES